MEKKKKRSNENIFKDEILNEHLMKAFEAKKGVKAKSS